MLAVCVVSACSQPSTQNESRKGDEAASPARDLKREWIEGPLKLGMARHGNVLSAYDIYGKPEDTCARMRVVENGQAFLGTICCSPTSAACDIQWQ